MVIQIIQAWDNVHVKGAELRVRVGQRAERYKQWIQERVEIVRLPFIIEESVPTIPLVLPTPLVSHEEADSLRARILQLEQEKDEMEASLHKSTFEKNQLSWGLQQEELKLQELQERFNQKNDKAGKLKTCLNQADSGLGSLHEQLLHAQRESGRWGLLWNQTMKERSEAKKGFEPRILELTRCLKESQLRGDHEVNLKEEALRKNRSIPQRVKRDLAAYEELKIEHDNLVSDSIYWSGEFAVLKNIADDANAHAEEMQAQNKISEEKLSKMMDYISSTIGEFPRKVTEAWQYMTEANTHAKVFQFVMFCTTMGKRIGHEIEELQRKKPRN